MNMSEYGMFPEVFPFISSISLRTGCPVTTIKTILLATQIPYLPINCHVLVTTPTDLDFKGNWLMDSLLFAGSDAVLSPDPSDTVGCAEQSPTRSGNGVIWNIISWRFYFERSQMDKIVSIHTIATPTLWPLGLLYLHVSSGQN